MTNIQHLFSKEEKIPVLLGLDTSNGFEKDLKWHFFSEYMHDANIFVCNMKAVTQEEADQIKQIISQIKIDAKSEKICLIEIFCNKENSDDILIEGSWLAEDSVLFAAIDVILKLTKMNYSFSKSEIKTEFFEDETKILRIKIAEDLLKNRTISYDIGGVKQSKIATTIASIVTAVGGAIDR